VELYYDDIADIIRTYPRATASEIAAEIAWPASMTLLRTHVAAVRATVLRDIVKGLPAEPVVGVFDHAPGSRMECGLWRPPVDLPVGFGQRRVCPVVLSRCAHCGYLAAVSVPSRQFPDVWQGQWELWRDWPGLPGELRWEGRVLLSHRFSYYESIVLDYRCRTELHGQILVGLSGPISGLNQARRALRDSFLPARTFASPTDFNKQLRTWVEQYNNTTISTSGMGTLTSCWGGDLKALMEPRQGSASLLDKPSCATQKTKATADGYVCVDRNFYKLGAWSANRKLTIETNLASVVISSSGYHAGGHHTVTYDRSWARRVTLHQPRLHTVSLPNQSIVHVEGP
jgi:hypothetical protein